MRRHRRNIGQDSDHLPRAGERQAVKPSVLFWVRLIVLLLPTLVVLALFVVWPAVRSPLPLERTSPAHQITGPQPDPSLLPLLVEEAFLKNRLVIAKTDSVALSIDLVDSLLTLDIKGVPVRVCRIERYKLSGALHRARRSPRLGDWLTRPFVLQREYGTIAKAPIKKVDAPKDTIEAEKLANMTPPPDSGDVAFVLDFTRNLTVKVCQSEHLSAAGRWRKRTVEANHRLKVLLTDMAGLSRRQPPMAPLVVSITIPRADAKAVYRALPRRALLAFRL